MQTHESELFGCVSQPETFIELVGLLRVPSNGRARVVRMWRGQADIAWPLHSAAYRRLAAHGPPPIESVVRGYEERLLLRATHQGFRFVDGRTLSDFELLARLQHHGAATRLLDATRSALVALFFAVADKPDDVGALFGFHTDFLGGHEEQAEDEPYLEVMKKIFEHKHPQTWQPTGVSARIAAQHSQFLYSAIVKSDFGSLAVADGSLQVIALTPTLKVEALVILNETFDIRRGALFPDIDGFGAANSSLIGTSEAYRW